MPPAIAFILGVFHHDPHGNASVSKNLRIPAIGCSRSVRTQFHCAFELAPTVAASDA